MCYFENGGIWKYGKMTKYQMREETEHDMQKNEMEIITVHCLYNSF